MECAKILNQLKNPLGDIETMAQAEANAHAVAQGEGRGAEEETGSTAIAHSSEQPDTKPVHTASDGAGEDGNTGASDVYGADAKPPIGSDTSDLSEPPSPSAGDDMDSRPAKKQMTLEEYEAMLDAEDGEGGFLEGGDIPSSGY